MFHCLVIKVVCLSSLCDSLFTLSYLLNLVKHFFQKFLKFSRSCLKLFVSVVLFKRLGYFIISSVICQQLNWIFWKLFYFSVFQKQFLATACLLYHCRKESSSTFLQKIHIFCTGYYCLLLSIISLSIFTNVNMKPICS